MFVNVLPSRGLGPELGGSGPALVLLDGRFEIRGYHYGNVYYVAVTAAHSTVWPDYDLRMLGVGFSAASWTT